MLDDDHYHSVQGDCVVSGGPVEDEGVPKKGGEEDEGVEEDPDVTFTAVIM